MNKKIITISREFGSGGHFIGEQVAKECNIPFYDKEIIEKIAEKTGFSKDYIEKKSEYASGKNIFSYAFVGRDNTGMSIADRIYEEQTRIIRELAGKESCVIIGRCSDYILKDHPDSLHIFIYGDQDKKSERLQKLYGVSEAKALQMMKEMDKKRSIHYKYNTDQVWGNVRNYTLSLNSSILGFEQCINIISNLYRLEKK